MNEYRIWFDVEGYGTLALPVNPQEVTVTYPGDSTSYDVEGVGEVIIPKLPKLATVTFESFFPRERIFQSMINSDSWYKPEWYVKFFRSIQKSKKPFGLTIARGNDTIYEQDTDGTRLTWEFDGQEEIVEDQTVYHDTVFKTAVLLDLSFTDKGGEPGDVYYTMSISEYRDASPKRLLELIEEETDDTTISELSDEEAIEGQKVVSRTYTIVKQRDEQKGVITAGTRVEASGNLYDRAESTTAEWRKVKAKANQVDRLVKRILPPNVSNLMHSVYIDELGWINKADCRISDTIGTANSALRLSGEV